MLDLIPPPVRPVRGCQLSRWQVVPISSGKRIEPVPPPSMEVVITPSDPFPVIEVDSHDWKRLRRRELYVPREHAPREIGGVNGKGFGPPRPRH